MIFYFFGFILYFIWRILKSYSKDRFKEVLIAAAYVVGIEVFLRMTKSYFLYEIGKYLVMFFIVIGLFYDGFKKKAFPYIVFLLLLIPAILVLYSKIGLVDQEFRKAILFNLSGPLCLGITAIYTFGKKLKYKCFFEIITYMVFPLISMTIYIYIYNPNIRDIITSTAANSAASGGYGPNQVATVLGLGMFILFTRMFIPFKNKLFQFVMIFFLVIMTLRGILTFSRGGILTALIMAIVFLIIYFVLTNLKSKVKTVFKIISMLGVIVFIWLYSVLQTGGLIENRYSNKDALGREKDDITTGRLDLISTELDAFIANPFLGVGVGQVKKYFLKEKGLNLPTHNEISRMLSEHGVFGIFALLILFLTPIINNPFGVKNIFFYPFLFFWMLTISHSAMRIAAPAFIYGLGLLNLKNEK